MCVYVCACLYEYACSCVRESAYMRFHVCVCMCECVRVYVCVCVRQCGVCVSECVCVCLCAEGWAVLVAGWTFLLIKKQKWNEKRSENFFLFFFYSPPIYRLDILNNTNARVIRKPTQRSRKWRFVERSECLAPPPIPAKKSKIPKTKYNSKEEMAEVKWSQQ